MRRLEVERLRKDNKWSNPRFANLNCHHATAVANPLSHDVKSRANDIVSLKFLPSLNFLSFLLGTPVGYTQVSSEDSRFRAALCKSSRVSFCVV